MKFVPRNLVLATLAVLAGCSARSSAAAPQTETREQAAKPEESKPKSDLTSVETTEEKREGLEEKLDSSLREFDGLILREQEILEERREEQAASGGGGAEGGSGGEGEGENGESGEGKGAERDDRTADAPGGTGGSPDDPSGEPVPTEDGAESSSDSGELSNGRIPPDVGDGRDDDIVARQLREAAMNEEDPALREKLWDEYRAYKFGTKKPNEKTP
jgi:hypothetical protein